MSGRPETQATLSRHRFRWGVTRSGRAVDDPEPALGSDP